MTLVKAKGWQCSGCSSSEEVIDQRPIQFQDEGLALGGGGDGTYRKLRGGQRSGHQVRQYHYCYYFRWRLLLDSRLQRLRNRRTAYGDRLGVHSQNRNGGPGLYRHDRRSSVLQQQDYLLRRHQLDKLGSGFRDTLKSN